MKIDIHTHILPPDIPYFKDKFGYGGFIHLKYSDGGCSKTSKRATMMRDDGKSFREVEANCWDPQVRIQECGQHGIDMQVLSTVPIMFSYWAQPQHGYDLSRFVNDHLTSVVQEHPKAFFGLGNLPMQSSELSIKELERCVKELKLSGVQIGSNINGKNLNDPEVFAVLEAAADLGAAVFVHPWDMMGEARMQKYWLPWLVGMPAEVSLAICSVIFGGVLEKLPKLRIAFAHGGGSFPGTIGRIEHGFQVRPDLCAIDNAVSPKSHLGKFYVDSLVHDETMLHYIVDIFGENRVALGTDYPFPLGELEPGKLIGSSKKFNEATKKRLLASNALEWLGR